MTKAVIRIMPLARCEARGGAAICKQYYDHCEIVFSHASVAALVALLVTNQIPFRLQPLSP